jgi:hypothetical protein
VGEPEEDEDIIEHLTAHRGWKVFTRPERKPEPADGELKELLREINGRRRPTKSEEPDDSPDAA